MGKFNDFKKMRCKITYDDGVASDPNPTLFKDRTFEDELEAIKVRKEILKKHPEENPEYYWIENLETETQVSMDKLKK